MRASVPFRSYDVPIPRGFPVVTDAVKKYREILAYGLLGVAALYLISGLSLLFKSEEDTGGLGFADRAGLFGYLFAHPLLIASLAAAVALATGLGGASRHARSIVMVALVLGGLAALLALVSWLSSLGSDSGFETFGGVSGAGKVVGILLGLAHVLTLCLALLFAYSAFAGLPRAARATPGGWGSQPGGSGWGSPGQHAAGPHGPGQWGQPGGTPSWGGQDAGYGQPSSYPASGWGGQSQAAHGGYGPSTWGPQQYAGGGASAAAGSDSPSPGWEQQQRAERPWATASGETWSSGQEQHSWGQPAAFASGGASQDASASDQQRGWGAPAGEHEQPPAAETSTREHPGDTTPGEHRDDRSDERRPEDQPPSQGWWQQPSP